MYIPSFSTLCVNVVFGVLVVVPAAGHGAIAAIALNNQLRCYNLSMHEFAPGDFEVLFSAK